MVYFLDENGEKQEEIPEIVLQLFRNTYGIELSYDSETAILTGTAIKGSKVNADVQKIVLGELEKEEVSEHILVFGHELSRLTTKDGGLYPKIVSFGLNVNDELTTDKSISYIDLADFDAEGNVLQAEFGEVDSRTWNLARVFEHEYYGHGVSQLRIEESTEKEKGNLDYMNNNFRAPLNLPWRVNYSISGDGMYRTVFQIDTLNKTVSAPESASSKVRIIISVKDETNFREGTYKAPHIPPND